jgi:predicted kinase
VPFLGLWLDAPVPVLEARLRSRRGDASDADVEVLRHQLATGAGDLAWHRLNAGGTPDAVFADAKRLPAFAA